MKQIVFLAKDFAQLVAHDIDLFDDEVTEGTRVAQSEMLADTEIEVAGRGTGEGRDLASTAWLSGGGGGGIALNPSQGAGEWDQFAANKQQFNVESSYNFDDYTTKLEGKFSAKQLAEAERIAREIEEGDDEPAPRRGARPAAAGRGDRRPRRGGAVLRRPRRAERAGDAGVGGRPPPSLGAGASKPAGSQPPLPARSRRARRCRRRQPTARPPRAARGEAGVEAQPERGHLRLAVEARPPCSCRAAAAAASSRRRRRAADMGPPQGYGQAPMMMGGPYGAQPDDAAGHDAAAGPAAADDDARDAAADDAAADDARQDDAAAGRRAARHGAAAAGLGRASPRRPRDDAAAGMMPPQGMGPPRACRRRVRRARWRRAPARRPAAAARRRRNGREAATPGGNRDRRRRRKGRRSRRLKIFSNTSIARSLTHTLRLTLISRRRRASIKAPKAAKP